MAFIRIVPCFDGKIRQITLEQLSDTLSETLYIKKYFSLFPMNSLIYLLIKCKLCYLPNQSFLGQASGDLGLHCHESLSPWEALS